MKDVVTSIESNCPACHVALSDDSLTVQRFEGPFSPVMPRMRVVTENALGKSKPTVVGFQFECPRCSYSWQEGPK